ncbi:hypothetical protein [Vibrio harveyi]|uniref:hypothetical protein n=1 Tax=Vibrio harveyi TaxID=669 RepID=UPI0033901A06
MKSKAAIIVTFCMAVMFSLPMTAKDLGRIGATFPIGEVDMLKWIDQRLRGFEKSGEFTRMQNEFSQRVKQSVKNPKPLTLQPTTSPNTFLVDPSLTLAKDLKDAHGNVFVKAGTRINPFDTGT